MFADALRDLFVGQSELFGQAAQAPRLFDWIEVGTLQVFDQAEDELFVVACVAANDCRHRVEAGEFCRAPPALTGDQLVAVVQPADEQRLEHPVQADRFGELTKGLGIKARAHLLMRRTDLVDRDHLRHESFALARHRDQRFESSAETAHPWLAHRSNSSFARARYAIAPRHVGSYSITDLPWLGASLIRTFRGINVCSTSCGYERRTDSRTSQDSVVRASNCVMTIPAITSLGLSPERTSWCVYMRCRRTSR